jgi:hypothetical protein
MTKPTKADMERARQARFAAIVMCVAIVGWFLLQQIGREYGWQARFAFLIDFAALAAFGWALVVTFRIWRQGRAKR